MEYVPVSEPSTLTRGGETQLVTLPVSTPPEFYRNDDGKTAEEVRASPRAASTPTGPSSGAICRNCGVLSPPSVPRCFPADSKNNTTHDFMMPGKDTQERKVHLMWQVLYVLIILGCYTVAIIYTVIPIKKYLEQDPVTVFAARNSTSLPFPAIQICNFNFNRTIEEIKVYWVPVPSDYIELNLTATQIGLSDDYDIDTPFYCHEFNNVANGGLRMTSTRQKIVVIAKCPTIDADGIPNDLCPGLCDPSLPENATIYAVNPTNEALGVSIAAFSPDGTPRTEVLNNGVYLPSGYFSQVSLKYSQFWPLNAEKPEETYAMTTSSVKYPADTFGNASEFVFYDLSEVIFTQISFSQLDYSQVNETKTYEAFNAFGDATAIVGFVTGFGVFGGPTVLTLLIALTSSSFLRKLFYA